MQFRYARHTDDIDRLVKFYTDIIGLERLGGFEEHAGYNGVFLGQKGKDWHIEFTTSPERADHHADADDLLVFYCDSREQMDDIIERATAKNIATVKPKNDYWQHNGVTLADPDGFLVVVTM